MEELEKFLYKKEYVISNGRLYLSNEKLYIDYFYNRARELYENRKGNYYDIKYQILN